MFGLDLLMPLIENSSNTWGTGEKAQEQARRDARYDYLQNEQYGIQARVEGAKAAGLHPLAALGFQAGAPSQVVGGEGTNTSGLSFGQTARPEKATDQEMRDAQLRLLNAQAANNEAEAQFHLSQRARATQPGNPPAYPTDPDNLPPGQGLSSQGIKVVPNEIKASVDGIQTGTHPWGSTIRGPDGHRYRGLSEEVLKNTEDMEFLRTVLFAGANKDRLMEILHQFDRSMTNKLNPGYPDNRDEIQRLLRRYPKTYETRTERNWRRNWAPAERR